MEMRWHMVLGIVADLAAVELLDPGPRQMIVQWLHSVSRVILPYLSSSTFLVILIIHIICSITDRY